MLNDMELQELRHNYEQLTQIIYQKEKQIQFLETKAVNLSMFYVASQLIIFLWNPEAQACRKRSWQPFLLSLSIAVAFGTNWGSTVVKYASAKQEQDRNYIDREDNFHQMSTLRSGGDGSTCLTIDMQQQHHHLRPDMFAEYQRYAHLAFTLASLLAITALVLHACLPIFRRC